MILHKYWCEYETHDIRRIEVYYESRHAYASDFIDECEDFMKACEHVKCWGIFNRLRGEQVLPEFLVEKIMSYMNGAR